MLARFCRGSLLSNVKAIPKCPPAQHPFSKLQTFRVYSNEGRGGYTRSARRNPTLAERAMAPAGGTAIGVGKAALAGGAVIGLGALCYYGLGLASETGAIDRAAIWPQYVKERISTTYAYFGGSFVISALSAAACLRSPAMMRLVANQSGLACLATIGAMFCSNILLHSIPYQEGFGAKQMAWMFHSGLIGSILAPLSFVGGPVLIRAAWYTAGLVVGLSTVAVCAPSEKFLMMSGPLAMGFGIVFVSSIGTFFLPPHTALGSGVYSIAIYGGLLLFSGMLLYHTQKIIKQAETYPPYKVVGMRNYDPINNAMAIYADTLNIFLRFVTILSGNNRRQ